MKSRTNLWSGTSLFAVMLVWSLSMPLFSGPDEPANFVKSAAVVRGEFVGKNFPATLQASYWTTYVDIDPKFGAANGIPWCFAPMREKSACDLAVEDAPVVDDPPFTNMGRYPPLAFAISGFGTVFGPTDLSVRASRFALAAACAVLIALAMALLRRRGRPMVTLLVAMVPATIFLSSTMSPSGLETSAALLLWVASLSVFSTDVDRLAQISFALAGIFVISTRPIGALIYVLILVISSVAVGRAGAFRDAVSRMWIALTVHLGVIGAMLAWYLTVYDVQSSNSLVADQVRAPLISRIAHGLASVPRMFDEGFGDFGWLDTPMPRLPFYILLAVFFSLVAQGLFVATRRLVLASGLVVCAVVAMVVVIDLNYYELFRLYGVQGRHVMPVLLGLPLVAGWRLSKSRRRDVAVASLWALVMVWAFSGALRRYAVGIEPDNAFDTIFSPEWTPVIGVLPSLSLIVIASSAFAYFALRD